MKSFVLTLLFIFCNLFLFAQIIEKSFVHNDSLRSYLLYVPAAYDGTEDWPLVINYHEFGMTSEDQMTLTQMNMVADTGHFLIAYPQGLLVFNEIPMSEDLGWNESGTLSDTDDVDFSHALIQDISASHSIAPLRVYGTGLGMGGSMANKVVCDLPDLFAAVGTVGNLMTDIQLQTCMPERPVSSLYMMGTSDPFIPFDPDSQHPIITQGLQGSIDFWTQNNNCPIGATETEFEDINTGDNSTVTLLEYTHCDVETELVIYRVNNGGHTWPGGGLLPDFFGGINQDINASSEIWNFFNRNPHPNLVSSKNITQVLPIHIYPNPVANQVLIDINLPKTSAVACTLINTYGQTVAQQNFDLNKGQQTINWSLALANLPTGLYVLQLNFNEINEMVSRLIIKE